MKKILCILVSLLLCIPLYAQNKGNEIKKIVGRWSYSAPEAPIGYQDGSLQINQKDGKLCGELNIQGSVISIREIKQEGKCYTCYLMVDGHSVNVRMKSIHNTLDGEADVEGMNIPILFTRSAD